jgi:hypothetical protein
VGCDVHVYCEIKKDDKWETVQGACEECGGSGEDEDTIPTCSKCGLTEGLHVDGKCLFDPGNAVHYKKAPCWRCSGDKIVPVCYGASRDYELFGKLSDVRGNGPKLEICVDGMPEDSGPLLVKASTCVDWHSHTHAMLDDLLKVDWDGHGDWRKTLRMMKKLGPPEKTRVVWWYDN